MEGTWKRREGIRKICIGRVTRYYGVLQKVLFTLSYSRVEVTFTSKFITRSSLDILDENRV